MSKLRDLIKSLIVELSKAQAPRGFPETIHGEIIIPCSVAAGDGSSLILTHSMEKLIVQIGTILKQEDPARSRSHMDEEWIRMVRAAFGPPLAHIDLISDPDLNADAVLKVVRESLAENAGDAREYAFGCTLSAIATWPHLLSVPVRFEPRIEWLERKEKEGAFSSIIARRVRKRWLGEEVRKRKRFIEWSACVRHFRCYWELRLRLLGDDKGAGVGCRGTEGANCGKVSTDIHSPLVGNAVKHLGWLQSPYRSQYRTATIPRFCTGKEDHSVGYEGPRWTARAAGFSRNLGAHPC